MNASLLLSLMTRILLLDLLDWSCADCEDFTADCAGCFDDPDCSWCPTEARCERTVFIAQYADWIVSSCTERDDFTQDYCSRPGLPFSDPLYEANEWFYDMIRVVPVWERGYFGEGIHVRINDDGVNVDHDEFDGRIDFASNCESFRPSDGGTGTVSSHGTTVASIVGGGGDNDVCAVGVAPKVILSSCNVLNDGRLFGSNLENVDVSQNSFGSAPCLSDRRRLHQRRNLQEDCPFTFTDSLASFPCDECDFEQENLGETCIDAVRGHCDYHFDDDTDACIEFLDLILSTNRCFFISSVPSIPHYFSEALQEWTTNGRDGKGTIFVFASGNSNGSGDSLAHRATGNDRRIINVGAVGKDGRHASYSTPGASLFLTAPGGDLETVPATIFAASLGSRCEDSSVGTSFSAPIVSGVIALMLEANPDLTWRDVQYILAETSQSVPQDPDDESAVVNGAGLWHSDYYGFGIVDAFAAVSAAQTWRLVEVESELSVESEPSLNIPLEDAVRASSTLRIDANDSFVVESVSVLVRLTHASRGHLEIALVSPLGTRSILTPGNRPENQFLDEELFWELLSLKSWGENPTGEWTLEILDRKNGDVGLCTDYYWLYEFPNGGSVTCGLLESGGACEGGDVISNGGGLTRGLEYNGRDAQSACCACGGGQTSNSITDQLNEWKLVVNGRYKKDATSPNNVTIATTQKPTLAPAAKPPSATPVEDSTATLIDSATSSSPTSSAETTTAPPATDSSVPAPGSINTTASEETAKEDSRDESPSTSSSGANRTRRLVMLLVLGSWSYFLEYA